MIYHFNLAYLDGMSGGDRYLAELVRYLSKIGVPNAVVTTESGAAQMRKDGLKDGSLCSYITVPDFLRTGGGPLEILAAYAARTVRATNILKALRFSTGDLIYCHNEFFPNIIPLKAVCRTNPNLPVIHHLHMTAPNLWRGYKGQFTGRRSIPNPRLLHYHFEQFIFRRLVEPQALIITNNHECEKTAAAWFPRNRTYNIRNYGGVEVPQSDGYEKEYDLVWCGRFHEQKGLPLAVEVLSRIKSRRPMVRMAVIGHGKPWEQRLKIMVAKKGLQDHVDILGYIDGARKYEIMHLSKVFLMTSLFESHGQVNLEAMKCGLPVVAFDLPPFRVFEHGMIRVPIADTDAMAAEVERLLDDQGHYATISAEAFAFAEPFSWENTGAEVFTECIEPMLDKTAGTTGESDDQE